jgi:hypothetical protein
MVNQRLITLRKKIRSNGKNVIDTLIRDHLANICIFCGSTEALTKEHVIPRWAFNNNPIKNFVTSLNGLSQKYSKTTVPACSECNSLLLGSLESYLENIFSQIDLGEEHFDNNTLEKIVLWLELIDYKFQVLDLRRKLKKPKNSQYIPYLTDIPISIMTSDSPYKAFSNLRNALKKLRIKSKSNNIYSLVVYKTTNESFHFFHKANEFIFIELPLHEVAFFYFLNKRFESIEESSHSAMNIIKKAY